MRCIIVACLVLQAMHTTAQFQKTESPKEVLIGQSKTAGVKFAELYYNVTSENDTAYRLFYKDQRYTSISSWESVHLKGGSESLNGFYGALSEALEAEKGAESTFKLNETSVLVKTYQTLGTKYLLVVFDDTGGSGIMQITKKQLQGLFDKN